MAGKTGDRHRKGTGKRPKPTPKALANLKPPWQPGQSGNPKGNPRSLVLSAAYRAELAKVDPRDPHGRTNAELVAEAMVRRAKGQHASVMAAAEIADRTEGKPQQSISVTITDLMKRAKEDHGIDIASDPVLSALFAAASVDADGGGADSAAGPEEEE